MGLGGRSPVRNRLASNKICASHCAVGTADRGHRGGDSDGGHRSRCSARPLGKPPRDEPRGPLDPPACVCHVPRGGVGSSCDSWGTSRDARSHGGDLLRARCQHDHYVRCALENLPARRTGVLLRGCAGDCIRALAARSRSLGRVRWLVPCPTPCTHALAGPGWWSAGCLAWWRNIRACHDHGVAPRRACALIADDREGLPAAARRLGDRPTHRLALDWKMPLVRSPW
ncbi:hypothetical protein BCF44_110187 [Kutzneria buriramensis]|uniref:Uncharacterized protein n=1 Tax=Kutzneria buriramensis TaxID=1045776 RepID=A0A3E0HCW0_9PSEU|nr:hypothetical protein BCF44_110187 [Kutzneria buriramensis]